MQGAIFCPPAKRIEDLIASHLATDQFQIPVIKGIEFSTLLSRVPCLLRKSGHQCPSHVVTGQQPFEGMILMQMYSWISQSSNWTLGQFSV